MQAQKIWLSSYWLGLAWQEVRMCFKTLESPKLPNLVAFKPSSKTPALGIEEMSTLINEAMRSFKTEPKLRLI
jgi:hypothetical protein